ncbi:ABC transporter permease subunit [Bacillus sp. M6-12]|uniref:ABC transporter permease subunit n=1 Tax=Bacillus sp. M6-12 TaxID=2054166 RepID=UPI001157FAB1|nr:ABC transporter permease subunit [Bacillus sp. M6-12]
MKLYFASAYELLRKIIFFDNESYWEASAVFPRVLLNIKESFYILGYSFLTAFLFSAIVVYICFLLLRKWVPQLSSLFNLMEAVPDILVICLLQLAVIYLYKKLGIHLFQVVSFGQERSLLLPVLSLSLPASFYFIKSFMFGVLHEEEKHYAQFAKAVGFSDWYILNRHILRNIVDELVINSKTVVWTMLSTLFIIERLYNIHGITMLIYEYPTPEMFFLGATAFFIPVFLVYKLYELLVPRMVRGERA